MWFAYSIIHYTLLVVFTNLSGIKKWQRIPFIPQHKLLCVWDRLAKVVTTFSQEKFTCNLHIKLKFEEKKCPYCSTYLIDGWDVGTDYNNASYMAPLCTSNHFVRAARRTYDDNFLNILETTMFQSRTNVLTSFSLYVSLGLYNIKKFRKASRSKICVWTPLHSSSAIMKKYVINSIINFNTSGTQKFQKKITIQTIIAF